MVNGGFNLCLHARDLAFQDGDAGVELLDRQWIEVLLDEQSQRVAWFVRKELIQIHGARVRRPHVGVNRQRDISPRSEEHTSELQSLMRISYAVFCFKKKQHNTHQ